LEKKNRNHKEYCLQKKSWFPRPDSEKKSGNIRGPPNPKSKEILKDSGANPRRGGPVAGFF